MKKQKLKNCLKIGILIFGIPLLLWNCQKEDDNQNTNSDQNKNKSVTQTSINHILNQNSLSKETFGLMSKNQKTGLKDKNNEPTFKLSSSKGLKYENNGSDYHVFLMERTDKADSYYYNLVVHEHNGLLDKYIYKYPLDKSSSVSISKIGHGTFGKDSKSVSTKNSGGDCNTTHFYNVIPCPCVGHLDPLICFCFQRPIWTYSHAVTTCVNPNPTNPDIEEPDNDNDPDIGGGIRINSGFDPNTGCYRSGGCYPDDSPEPIPYDPSVPLPNLEPDFGNNNGNSFLLNQLDLTNEQQDWLDKLENINFKTDIENHLKQFIFKNQFNDAKIFAKQAVIAWMLNRNIKIDLEESFKSPFNVDLELVRPTILNPESEKVLFMCIYNKLLKTPQFKELFKNVFGDNERLNVKFEFATDLEPTTGASTQVISHLVSNGKVVGINQTIKLNKDWYGARSDIKIANSILHECIHAYLNVKQTECEENTTLTQINAWELDDLINKIYTENKSCIFSNEPANQDDHHFMFNNLVPNMANIISQLKDDLISEQHQLQAEGNTYYNDETNLPENFDWNDLFKYLAMDGLNKTNTFKENIENNVLENTKYGFYSSNNAEGVTKNNCND